MSETVTVVVVSLYALTVLLALAAIGARAYLRTTHGRRPEVDPGDEVLLKQRVIVQLKDGSAVAGVITRRVGEFYVLEAAQLHEGGGSVGIDGAAWVERGRINWIQVEGTA